VRVLIESIDGREHWTRFFEGNPPMRSVMQPTGEEGFIEERFGPVTVTMKLEARIDGLDMLPHKARFGPVPLPKFLTPVFTAQERVDELGRHRFDVEIGLPGIGRLVGYKGYLRV
jgi:hypothetical protein